MRGPETFVERQVDKILEKLEMEEIVNQPTPAPVWRPSFAKEANSWRARLFPVGAVLGASLTQTSLFLLAPTYYRAENSFNIAALSLAGLVAGMVVAEAFAYYFADRYSG